MIKLAVDQGYSSAKVKYDGKFYKIPTAVCFHNDIGIDYGEEEVYDYKDQKFYVGDQAVSGESFSTGDYGFKKQYDPLILFSILRKLNLIEAAKNQEINLFLTLSLADWKYKDEYLDLFNNFTVNGITLSFNNITLVPQGAGVYMTFMQNREEHPDSVMILDIGAVTINTLFYEFGKPQKLHSKGHPGHGVMISIIQPFAAYLESNYSMPFSNAEAMKIFTSGKFIFSGSVQDRVSEKITELKKQFVQKLFNSVLTSEKKLLATSEKVILAGGGVYMLEGINFPPNVELTDKPYEFANVSAL